jgi:hypothetical protein
MRVVVTRIGPDGTMRRRMVDTAASVYHIRVGEQIVLVAEHDLSGPLYDLVTAVLAIGEAPH